MIRECATPGCRNTPQPGQHLCIPSEIAVWQVVDADGRNPILPCGHPYTSKQYLPESGTSYCSDCISEEIERRR